MRRCCLLVVLLFLASGAGAALDLKSGHAVLPQCDALLQLEPTDLFGAGRCIGMLETLNVTRWKVDAEDRAQPRYCPPPDVTLTVEARIVVDYLQAHPEQLHQPGVVLALTALQEAFPCPR